MLLFVSVWNREDTKQKRDKKKRKKEQTWVRVTQKGGTDYPENLICLPGFSTGKLQAEQNPASPNNQIKLVLMIFLFPKTRPQASSMLLNMFSQFYLLSQIYGLSWSSWSVLRRPEPRPCNVRQIILPPYLKEPLREVHVMSCHVMSNQYSR